MSANNKQGAIVTGASSGIERNHMSEPERLPDSSDLSMKAIITDEASIAKVKAELIEPLSLEHEPLQAKRSRVAHDVTRNSFRSFGINE